MRMPSPVTDPLALASRTFAHASTGARDPSLDQAHDASRDRGRAARRAQRHAEDVALVRRIMGGDEDAFRALVERYQKRLYWLAYDILLDGEEARDAVQEAFIRVHAALDRYDPQRDFQNWIYRIARNLAIDALRRRRRRATLVGEIEPLLAPQEGQEPGASVNETRERVDRALAQLPMEYRLALTLREFHGLSPREVARVTDCTYPTARWRLHRARLLFKAAWEAQEPHAPEPGPA